MKKAKALTDFLVETLDLDRNKLFADVAKLRLMIGGKHLGLGIAIARCEYTLEFDYEGLTKGREDYILPAVAIWLLENDPKRDPELGEPMFEAAVLDEVVDLSLDVQFRDEITLVEDPNGRLPFKGKTYRIGEVPVYEAEEFTIITSVSRE